MREADAFASQKFDHVEELVDRFGVGPDRRDLTADVAVDADGLEPGMLMREAVEARYVAHGNAELVVEKPRGNVGVGVRVDVRVAAKADARGAAQALRHAHEAQEFAFGLDVDRVERKVHGAFELPLGLAHARKNDFLRIGPRAQGALHLADADGVETRTETGEQREDAARRIRLHGVAHQVRMTGKTALPGGEVLFDLPTGVYVGGAFETFGQIGEVDVFAVKRAADARKGGSRTVCR